MDLSQRGGSPDGGGEFIPSLIEGYHSSKLLWMAVHNPINI